MACQNPCRQSPANPLNLLSNRREQQRPLTHVTIQTATAGVHCHEQSIAKNINTELGIGACQSHKCMTAVFC
jgi:hypothetical protein